MGGTQWRDREGREPAAIEQLVDHCPAHPLVVTETFDNGPELVETVSSWQGTSISRRLATTSAV